MDGGVTARAPLNFTTLGGSDPDTTYGLAGGMRVGGGKRQACGSRRELGGTVPSPTLRLGRETAPGRGGQANASVCSDLNLCSQCWLRGVILCAPRIGRRVPIWRRPHPGRDQAGTTRSQQSWGRQEGAVKITSPSRGLISLPFVSAKATWTLSERESRCQGFTDLFSF